MKTTYIIIAAIVVIVIIIGGVFAYIVISAPAKPAATPVPTATPTATPTTAPTLAPTAAPTASPTASPSPAATPSPVPTPTPPPTTLTVFAASSLTYVIANMTAAFDKQYDVNLVVNAGSSSTLEQQIATGSPCDVFMSADTKWTNALNSSNLVYQNYIINFTTNKLVVILAQGNPKNITSLDELASTATGAKKVHIVVAETSVPVGLYTNETLTAITNTWGNSSSPNYVANGSYVNYYTNFENNVINYLQSDEQVVGAVNLNVGVADAGIVFYSDEVYANMVGETVSFIQIPNSVNTIGTYGICIPSETTQSALAQDFYNYWLSSQGQSLLTEFGFGT